MTQKKAQHRELEIKLDARDVNIVEFNQWCFGRDPAQYLHVTGPDVYYAQGKNVLRHRQNGGAGELTVKRRTSKKTTTDRLEIDLRFDSKTEVDDVSSFLEATGWKAQFTVIKDCHIHWFDRKPGIEVVLYEVRCIYPNKREAQIRQFLEVEIHKADSLHPQALTTLRDWEKALRERFSLDRPAETESLYEIYSGERYGMVKR